MTKRAKSSKSKARALRVRAKTRAAGMSHKQGPKAAPSDSLDDLVDAAARALDLTVAPQWGQVSGWAIKSPAPFMPPAPPALDSARYAADFNRTKSLGAADSTTRTQDQTLFAHFWADVPGHSVTPPGIGTRSRSTSRLSGI